MALHEKSDRARERLRAMLEAIQHELEKALRECDSAHLRHHLTLAYRAAGRAQRVIQPPLDRGE